MSISEKTVKILWANAAGRCAFLDCKKKLYTADINASNYTTGEMAHICGKRPTSNRYTPHQTDIERDSYKNLILLCPNHHTLIDKPENEEEFNVEVLLEIKAAHETYIDSKISQSAIENKYDIARVIQPLLNENHSVWLHYGPQSDNARQSPNDDSTHALWLSERLSTIIPNNRNILDIVNNNITLFDWNQQSTINEFKLHVQSYEKWVKDEIPYSSVIRFPIDFELLIKELLDACP